MCANNYKNISANQAIEIATHGNVDERLNLIDNYGLPISAKRILFLDKNPLVRIKAVICLTSSVDFSEKGWFNLPQWFTEMYESSSKSIIKKVALCLNSPSKLELIVGLALVLPVKIRKNPDLLSKAIQKIVFENYLYFRRSFEKLKKVSFSIDIGFKEHPFSAIFNRFSADQTIKLLTTVPVLPEIFMNSSPENIYYFKHNCLQEVVGSCMFYLREIEQVLQHVEFDRVSDLRKLSNYLAPFLAELHARDCEEAGDTVDYEEPILQENFYPQLLNLDNFEFRPGMRFVIPLTRRYLIEWGTELHICIGSPYYFQKAKEGNCILLGITVENKITYCLEIIDGSIVQASGACNSWVEATFLNEIILKLGEFGICSAC